MSKNFKNQGSGSEHETQVIALLEDLGFRAERVAGKGNGPDLIIWDGYRSYGAECKANVKNSASYVTFKVNYDLATDTLTYKSNAECELVQEAKSKIFAAIVKVVKPFFRKTKLIEIPCEKTERSYSALVPQNQPSTGKLKKEIISRTDKITIDAELVYDFLMAKNNQYLIIDKSIIPLVDDYLHLPDLLKKAKAPNYFYIRARSKKISSKSQKHSLEIQVYCGGYTTKAPKINSKVTIEK